MRVWLLFAGRIVPAVRLDVVDLPRRLLLGLGSLPPNLEALVGDALDEDRKIVVVTGGVLSGIGKGVTASSIGVVSFWRNYIPTLRMAYFD